MSTRALILLLFNRVFISLKYCFKSAYKLCFTGKVIISVSYAYIVKNLFFRVIFLRRSKFSRDASYLSSAFKHCNSCLFNLLFTLKKKPPHG